MMKLKETEPVLHLKAAFTEQSGRKTEYSASVKDRKRITS